MYKRFLLFILIFSLIFGGAALVFYPYPEKEIKKAFIDFKQNKWAAAEKRLNGISLHKAKLYKNYIELVTSHTHFSERRVNHLIQLALKESDSSLLYECFCIKGINAYFAGRDPDFNALIERAHELAATGAGHDFLCGLASYLKEDYHQALSFWAAYLKGSKESWLAASIASLFSEEWLKLHIAHCQIETGEYALGRENIEKIASRSVENGDIETLAPLILGLSYLREGGEFTPEKRGTFYKVACFYFNQARSSEMYPRERKSIIAAIESEIQRLFLVEGGGEPMQWGVHFVHVLEQWQAEAAMDHIADHLAQHIVRRPTMANPLCSLLCEEFRGGRFLDRLTLSLLEAMSTRLKGGHSEELLHLWQFAQAISPNPKGVSKHVVSLTKDEMFDMLRKDNLQLSQTQQFLSFWESLNPSAAERDYLAHELLSHAKLLWQSEREERKGHSLMKHALALSHYNPQIEKEIATFLMALFAQAESSNMMRRLRLIHNAMESFDIKYQDSVSKSGLANHLADAHYLYKAHNYLAAKNHAIWVLKLDSTNEEARRLVGLSAFHLGEYAKAFNYLQGLSRPDEEANKALMLSQAFAAQEGKKHLCQMDSTDSFDDD